VGWVWEFALFCIFLVNPFAFGVVLERGSMVVGEVPIRVCSPKERAT
jgi:hypothetical protein